MYNNDGEYNGGLAAPQSRYIAIDPIEEQRRLQEEIERLREEERFKKEEEKKEKLRLEEEERYKKEQEEKKRKQALRNKVRQKSNANIKLTKVNFYSLQSPEFKICIGNNIIFKRNAEILAEKKRKEAEKEQQQRNKEKQLAAKVEDRRKSSQNFQTSFCHMSHMI